MKPLCSKAVALLISLLLMTLNGCVKGFSTLGVATFLNLSLSNSCLATLDECLLSYPVELTHYRRGLLIGHQAA